PTLDEDPPRGGAQEDLPAVAFDRLGETVGEDLAGPLGEVGAIDVVGDERRAHRERRAARREGVIAALAGEHRPEPLVLRARVEELPIGLDRPPEEQERLWQHAKHRARASTPA